ncbi:MAG: hypothetical protein WAU64_05490 [Methanoregula sp.]|uniref:hypothetical protein n=1 Tax=Methanoregula sp. TaxID=2052170 RepID=UPI003BB1EC6B
MRDPGGCPDRGMQFNFEDTQFFTINRHPRHVITYNDPYVDAGRNLPGWVHLV